MCLLPSLIDCRRKMKMNLVHWYNYFRFACTLIPSIFSSSSRSTSSESFTRQVTNNSYFARELYVGGCSTVCALRINYRNCINMTLKLPTTPRTCYANHHQPVSYRRKELYVRSRSSSSRRTRIPEVINHDIFNLITGIEAGKIMQNVNFCMNSLLQVKYGNFALNGAKYGRRNLCLQIHRWMDGRRTNEWMNGGGNSRPFHNPFTAIPKWIVAV